MKRNIFKILIALICVPILALCGCSNKLSKLPKLDATIYFEQTVKASTYGSTKTKDIDLSELLSTKADTLNIDSFTELKLTANSTWIYKMYINRIYFYVYTNEAASVEMIVNVSITNLADENDIQHPNNDFSVPCSFVPTKAGSHLCYVDVNKTVATATGCTITFDILNSTSGTIADNEGNLTTFRWMIHGLEFYGEHRAY